MTITKVEALGSANLAQGRPFSIHSVSIVHNTAKLHLHCYHDPSDLLILETIRLAATCV